MFKFLANIFRYSTPIETPGAALAMGERIAHERFPDINYERYRPEVINGDDRPFLYGSGTWCVAYFLTNDDGQIDENVLGGGGPEILIRKSDGKVLKVNLQR